MLMFHVEGITPRGHVFKMFERCLLNISQTFSCFCTHFHVYKPTGMAQEKSTNHENVWKMCENFSRKKKIWHLSEKIETHVFMCMFPSANNGSEKTALFFWKQSCRQVFPKWEVRAGGGWSSFFAPFLEIFFLLCVI